ncbi:MAG TPA: polyhydroxyalkanoate synthesis regulator [Firmicutes bacterium]|nr:polyhydroxyalkanoate synthesis regulator [Bacillota bacterium]HHY97582.1 polyhydroxyalkanoate synthesis regulator [Bacillota bacterium]
MIDTVNKIIDFGLGAVLLTREKIQKAMDECVKRGEMGRSEADRLVSELTKKGEEGRARLREAVRDEVEKIVGELGLATKKDLEELEMRLRQ